MEGALIRRCRALFHDKPLLKRLAGGTGAVLLGTIASRILGAGAAILTARILGAVAFGSVAVIQSTIATVGTLAGFGLQTTATKYVAQFRSNDQARAGRIMSLCMVAAFVMGCSGALVLLFGAPWIATDILHAPGLVASLRIGSVLLLLGTLNGVQLGALAGMEQFVKIARTTAWTGLANFPLFVGGAVLLGVNGVVLGMVGGSLVNCILNQLALREVTKSWPLSLDMHGLKSEMGVLWRFSFPAVLGNLLVAPVMWFAQLTVIRQNDGYAELGIYNAGAQWQNVVMFLPAAVGTVVLPMLSHLFATGEKGRFRKLVIATAGINVGVTAISALALGLLGPLIMRAYGREFRSGTAVLVLLLVAAVLSSGGSAIGQMLISVGRMWTGVLVNGIWGGTLILVALHSETRGLGARGLAGAMVISYVVLTFVLGMYALIVLRSRKRL